MSGITVPTVMDCLVKQTYCSDTNVPAVMHCLVRLKFGGSGGHMKGK
jgi:hypothetical protein